MQQFFLLLKLLLSLITYNFCKALECVTDILAIYECY